MVTIRIEAGDIVKAVIVIALLLSPFLLGWFLWGFLATVGFWQMIYALIFAICFVEGTIAWAVAVVLITE